jgi:hypothetical protein
VSFALAQAEEDIDACVYLFHLLYVGSLYLLDIFFPFSNIFFMFVLLVAANLLCEDCFLTNI